MGTDEGVECDSDSDVLPIFVRWNAYQVHFVFELSIMIMSMPSENLNETSGMDSLATLRPPRFLCYDWIG